MRRRNFIQKSGTLLGGLVLAPACATTRVKMSAKPKISLAQWSLNKEFFGGSLALDDFAKIARETYDLDAVEYVNQFYKKHRGDKEFWNSLNKKSKDYGVTNLLIMVDQEGDLCAGDDVERAKAVDNHKIWVDTAKQIGCSVIRVNAFGDSNLAVYKNAAVDAMGALSDYAAQANIDVAIENHGLFSSNAAIVVDIVQQVDRPNFGTYPDFGNWCYSREWGGIDQPCEEQYDTYQGMKEFMPYAKGISAKVYELDEDGNETRIDFTRVMKIIKDARYDGYISIEYEGHQLSPHEGILATQRLIERSWSAA